MEVMFLGTAAAEGWPAVFCHCPACTRARAAGGPNIRTRASALIDGTFKIDLGPDTYHQALTLSVDLGAVRHILITHTHADHYYPQELEMRWPPFAHPAPGQTDPGVDLYGSSHAVELATQLKVAVPADVKSRDNDPTEPNHDHALVRAHAVDPFAPFTVGDADVVALRADHKPDEIALFYLFSRGGRTLMYATDTGYFPDHTWQWLESEAGRSWVHAHGGLQLVVLDCTGGPLPGERAHGHMNIVTNLQVQQRLREDDLLSRDAQFVATHFSHNGGMLQTELEQAFQRAGGDFLIAYDGLQLNV